MAARAELVVTDRLGSIGAQLSALLWPRTIGQPLDGRLVRFVWVRPYDCSEQSDISRGLSEGTPGLIIERCHGPICGCCRLYQVSILDHHPDTLR